MFNYIKKKIEDYHRIQHEAEIADKLVFKLKKEFLVVAVFNARTNWTDTGHKDEHTFILKENGDGIRKVEIVNVGRYKAAYEHTIYVKYVKPWEHGMNFVFIPTFQQIYSQKAKPYTNY